MFDENRNRPLRRNAGDCSIEGDGAHFTYLRANITGATSRNTGRLTFNAGQIASVEVYFGAECRDGKFQSREALRSTPSH